MEEHSFEVLTAMQWYGEIHMNQNESKETMGPGVLPVLGVFELTKG